MNTNMKDKSNKPSRTYDLYLGHVPKTIQEAAIAEIFSKYGKVADVLIRHSAGTGTFGYAIVKFTHKKDAEKVLQNVKTIMVDNHEMEVKCGKRSSQSNDIANGSSKSVTFAEPCHAIQHADGNICMSEAPIYMNDFHCPVYPASENALLPVTVEIMCTNVEDAITFHGCIITNFEELSRLSMKLKSICPNLQRLTRKPIINKIYGGLFSADHQWYRCRVLRFGPHTNSSSCIVEYIDYGNIAEVSCTNMVELPEPLKNITPFAIKCVFTNLVPTAKSLNCVSYLHHLVNQRMSLCALNAWGSLEYLVTKCSCNGIDVITELVRNGSAMYKKQEFLRNTSPKMVKSSKMQENKKQKKQNDSHKNKPANSSNDTAKHSHEMKNGGITILEKSDRSNSSAESPDFTPKKIIKRGKDAAADNPILGSKSVNHLLKVDSVISSVKVINNIRSLIPLHSYDDLISEAVDLLKDEINITVSDDSKELVEKARRVYSEALKDIKECSDLNLLAELKEKRNQKQTELCNELEQYLKSFDCTLLEKRKKIQETITALESNSTAWLNVYLPKKPETIEDLLVSFNEEKEKKLKNIEMARKNTDERREIFLKIYADLGKEFSLSMVNGATDDRFVANNIGKKGSWALKFDEALTEFGIALEEERKISTVIEDRSYVSVIQCILEKLDIPKERIDAECDVYEKYKSLYDDLNSLNLNPIFDELHEVSKVINSFSSCSNADADKLSNEHFNLHSALLREDELLTIIIKASTQHFPELIAEHPELRLEDYQKNFCLLKFSWDTHFFPFVDKCYRIEPSYVSSLGDDSVVVKEFNIGYEYEKTFIKRVKTWNEIKSTALVKIRGLFKNMLNPSRCDETSCKWKVSVALANGDADIENQAKIQAKAVKDENQNTVTNMNSESKHIIKANCNWNDCDTGLMAHDELILHVFEDHVGKNEKPFICLWKDCSTKEKPFKTQELLILHMRNHISEKSLASTSRTVIYAVLPNVWETLYDKPLPIPVNYKVALNILQQVLEGLCNIHSRGIVHGAIHPMSILHKEGKILLDFNFDKQLLKEKLCINGINFQVPKEDFKSADMYGFGCLVLLVLFPNLSFQSTDEGVPNISAFQSIIENTLVPKDFDALYSLLKSNCNIRPTSRMLRSNGFLKELSIMVESSSSL